VFQSLKVRYGVFLAVIGSLFFFQNCASPPEDTSSATSSASNYQSKLPLAVSGQIDTISHMSCSEITDAVEPRAYFSYRAGAYSSLTGGLSLTQAYRDATKYYSLTERARAFAASDANADTRFTLSIRSAANYQSPWVSEELRVGEEVESLLPPLDSADVAGALAASSPGTFVNYFPGTGSKRLIEASLRFYKYENVMQDTRNNLDSGQSMLVAGFSASSDELNMSLRVPPDGVRAPGNAAPAYGRGYLLKFALPNGYTAGQRRVLAPASGVQELDISQSPPVYTNSSWDCSASYQFEIVRPEDKRANRVTCDATVDSVRTNVPSDSAVLAAIRRVLRVEDWYVDIPNHCVIPKRTGDYCYGPIGTRTIQYGLASCVNSTQYLCPHFVSVCVRR
jgi:hypothetical protein